MTYNNHVNIKEINISNKEIVGTLERRYKTIKLIIYAMPLFHFCT